jgi:hypothetical protein
MATDREQPDDVGDEQLAWLLTSAHDAPPMRAEFVSALSQKLDDEFAAASSARNGKLLRPLTNGDGKPHADLTAAPADSATAVEVAPTSGTTRRSRQRRWMTRIATVASLLLVVAIVSNPPAFAAAVRAIMTTLGELTGAIESRGDEQVAVVDIEDDAASAVQPVQQAPRVATAKVPQPVEVIETEIIELPADEEADKKQSVIRTDGGPLAKVSSEPPWQPFDVPLADGELTQRVDDELVTLWQANGIRPVGPATDAEFMRRVYLDLTGRIPSVSEVQEFLEDSSPDRREKLVDRLLEHHDHATHLAAIWRTILLPDTVDLSRLGGAGKFDEWLAEQFAVNKPYEQIVRDLLLAEGRVSESGPLLFYAALKLEPEELAARTSRAFLGVRMECAQCHDHFFDSSITQQDFWSFAAFFARISRPRGKMEMTSPVLAVRDNQHGEVTIPDTDEVVPPRLPMSTVEVKDDANGPARREQLVDWLTSKNNGHFARATVNRVWAHLFGRGLVEPVDDMRPDNKPIAPAVLDTLSRDFAASGFDLRRLLRALVLTQTYQLSSRSEDSDPSRTLHFAQMNMKSLTADQLYDCIAVATRQATMSGSRNDALGLMRFDDMSRAAFIEKFRAPAGQVTDYHAGIPQALTLMHGGLIHSATDMASSGLLKSLAAPFFTNDQRLDTLFVSTLSRYPTDRERELMVKPIAAATSTSERQQALGDVLWALLNSAEFTFNH